MNEIKTIRVLEDHSLLNGSWWVGEFFIRNALHEIEHHLGAAPSMIEDEPFWCIEVTDEYGERRLASLYKYHNEIRIGAHNYMAAATAHTALVEMIQEKPTIKIIK